VPRSGAIILHVFTISVESTSCFYRPIIQLGLSREEEEEEEQEEQEEEALNDKRSIDLPSLT